MASDSSAKAGSKVLRGNDAPPDTLSRAESRKEDRDDGRSGVVGRDVRDRDVDRARFVLESRLWLGIVRWMNGLCEVSLCLEMRP